jgi:hypothetical protein
MIQYKPNPQQWAQVEELLLSRFGKLPDMDALLYLIGLNELKNSNEKFTKEQKQDLIHVGACTLLCTNKYYSLSHYDEQGWPHFRALKPIPEMDMPSQENFLKQQAIFYFNIQ